MSPRPLLYLLVFSIVASASLLCAQEALPNHLSKRVVSDYVYWSKYQTPPYAAGQIPYHKLSHINHSADF